MFISISITSKNVESVKKFVSFLNDLCSQKHFKNYSFLKYFKVPSSKKVFTLLKSPHVNKTAQSQFEFLIFVSKVNLYSFKISKFLFALKNTNLKLFPDVKIKISFYFDLKKLKNKKENIFELDQYRLGNSDDLLKNKDEKIKTYLKLLDMYGEITFKIVWIAQ